MPGGKVPIQGVVIWRSREPLPCSVNLASIRRFNRRKKGCTFTKVQLISWRGKLRHAVELYRDSIPDGDIPTATERDRLVDQINTAAARYLKAYESNFKTSMFLWRDKFLSHLAVLDGDLNVNFRVQIKEALRRQMAEAGHDLYALQAYLQCNELRVAQGRTDLFEKFHPALLFLQNWDACKAADDLVRQQPRTSISTRDPVLAQLVYALAPIWEAFATRGLRRISINDAAGKRSYFADWVCHVLACAGIMLDRAEKGVIDGLVEYWELHGRPPSLWIKLEPKEK